MTVPTEILTLTEDACDRFRSFRRMHGDVRAAIRITVHPEAPVESKYELEFVDQSSATADDVQVVHDDLVFLLDPRSSALLQRTRIDYRQGMWSSGFQFENPNQVAVMTDPLAERIQKVIDEQIAPMVAAHGGRVRLVDVRAQRAFVQFGGGCQGCGLAPVTLKQGVVAALSKAVPEIVEIVDVTDHASGENPYYPQA